MTKRSIQLGIFGACLCYAFPMLLWGQHAAALPYQCGFVLENREAIREVYGAELAVLNLRSGEVIADVGGSNGYRMAMFATLIDSLHFYIQDIDTLCLNPTEMQRVIDYYTAMQGKPLNSTFQIVVGTGSESRLPPATFDKVIVTAAYHHFEQPAAMLQDLASKLKPSGKIYLIENVVRRHGQRRRRLCDDELMTEAEMRSAFECQGFQVEAVHPLGRWWTKMFVLRPH